MQATGDERSGQYLAGQRPILFSAENAHRQAFIMMSLDICIYILYTKSVGVSAGRCMPFT